MSVSDAKLCEQNRRLPGWRDDVIQSALDELGTSGFTCIRGIIEPSVLEALRSEALQKRHHAKAVCSDSNPKYRAHLAGLGEAAQRFLATQHMSGLMVKLFGLPLAPQPSASCYTYYQPGDFLGPHLDHAEDCRATAILYLDVVKAEDESAHTGLELHILHPPPDEDRGPRVIIPTEAGALVVGLGSQNWHKRPILQEGEYLAALTACYSMPPGSG